MNRPAEIESRAIHSAALRIASSPAEAWTGVLQEWFREAAAGSWHDTRPSLVVVPTRAHGNALRARLLQDRISHLGLRFVTPSILRDLLLREFGETPARREDLRLLLGIAAEELLRANSRDDEQQAAKAVMRAPDHLLRMLERLAVAGWEFEQLGLPSFRQVVGRFRDHLHETGLRLHAELDRLTLQRSLEETPHFSRVLVYGFDGAHWPSWFLLRAVVEAAEHATVLLEYPQADLDADATWIGSWEELLGEATDVSAPRARSDTFFTAEEMRGLGRSKRDCTFLVGSDTSEQAEAVALQCLRFLAQSPSARVGVVFGGPGSLPRLVGRALSRHEIPHNHGIGHSVPGTFESAEWRAWLKLQHGPRINSLLHFVRTLPDRGPLLAGISLNVFERTLRSAYAEVLLDDLHVLRSFCVEQKSDNGNAVAETIGRILFLPARAPFAHLIEETRKTFQRLNWKVRWLEIKRRIDDRLTRSDSEISRAIYLRWLEETAITFTKARDAGGEHPYARVHLLTVPEAQAQEWSHLIFAGWNEGSWPPPFAGEFVRETEIADFNRSIRRLNRSASAEGRQGEGHTALRDGHTFYPGPNEQRQIALRQFDALLSAASEAVAFSANLVQENTPERFWNPSELLTRVYQQTNRAPLTQAAMSGLQRATAAWLEGTRALTTPAETPLAQVEQTRVAYDARRDVNQPAGEYDFAFRSAPAHAPVFSVSDIERLVSAPALIWMKKFLGVEAADEGTAWQAATGQWVHHWLGQIGGAKGGKEFVRMPNAAEIDAAIRAAAERKLGQVKRLCASAGKPLPDWWTSGWQNASCISRHLAAKIATTRDWPWVATEWTIDPDQPVVVEDHAALTFRGRIDLLLSRDGSVSGECWIVDYKTGANKPLTPGREDVEKRMTRLHNRLVKGEALQLGLYALAIRERGAENVFLSIVSRAVRDVDPPQLSVGDIAAHADVFAELARMQQSGVFGMYGQLRPAFGYARAYPIATVPIDPDLLDAKWELTHPPLAREEEEWDF